MAPQYVKRALAGAVARATAPVVVLEGARGTGKTALVKNESVFRGFSYITLADEEEFARANAQPEEWVARMPRPIVIDEAQRIKGLLEVVQRAACEEQAAPLTFVLVCSERLQGGDSSDPQPERFTLFPLTQAEIHGRGGCIIDDLFDGDIVRRFCSFHTRSDLRVMMRVGGLPMRVAHPVRALSRRKRISLLGQIDLRAMSEGFGDVDDDIDQLIGKAILEKLLTEPGLSLGVDTVAASCSVDAATLTAYLGMLQDRFLIHRLTMLDRKKSQGLPFAKTRVHPADTMPVVEALQQTNHDLTVEPPVFAKVLRTFCIDQLVPATQWASEPTECCHWKKFDHRMREVDLVFKRGERLVGITMRNSAAARSDTIGALRLLAEDERFVRGFIIYLGNSPRQVAENIWAIPASALWEENAFVHSLSELRR